MNWSCAPALTPLALGMETGTFTPPTQTSWPPHLITRLLYLSILQNITASFLPALFSTLLCFTRT